jgi:hypothetical protein
MRFGKFLAGHLARKIARGQRITPQGIAKGFMWGKLFSFLRK